MPIESCQQPPIFRGKPSAFRIFTQYSTTDAADSEATRQSIPPQSPFAHPLLCISHFIGSCLPVLRTLIYFQDIRISLDCRIVFPDLSKRYPNRRSVLSIRSNRLARRMHYIPLLWWAAPNQQTTVYLERAYIRFVGAIGSIAGFCWCHKIESVMLSRLLIECALLCDWGGTWNGGWGIRIFDCI